MIIDLLVFNIIDIICLDISKAASKFCTYSYHVQRFVYQVQSWENLKKRYAVLETLDSGEIFKGMPHGRLFSLSTVHPILGFSLSLPLTHRNSHSHYMH